MDQFQIPDLFSAPQNPTPSTNSTQASSSSSLLSSLASNHLQSAAAGSPNAMVIPDLFGGGLTGAGNTNSSDLSSLAKKHLNIGQSNADTVPDVPDIFGSGKATSDEESLAANDYSPPSGSDLSLLSALKLADDVRQQQDSQKSEDSSNRKDNSKAEWTSRQRSHSEAFVIERISSVKAKRFSSSSSAFGRVICRRWRDRRRPRRQVRSQHDGSITRFAFDVPSPDELVLAAQSKVFKRPG